MVAGGVFALPEGRLRAADAGRAGNPRRARDDAGREVAIPQRPARVYAAGPPASVLVFALAPQQLAGWTTPFRAAERPWVPPRYLELPVLGRLTGRGGTASLEKLVAARPDLIVDYGSVNPTFASLADRVQAQTGIPYVLVDGRFDALDGALARLGEWLGAPEAAARWRRLAAETLAAVASIVDPIPPQRRPGVYYARGPKGLVTALEGSINAEVIVRAGGRNVAASLGRGGLAQVSLEQVLAWQPDSIVTVDPTFHASVWQDPLWRTVPAVRARRVHLAPALPFGWVDFPPSVNRLIGLRWLAGVLHGERATDELRERVRAFYALAYHRAPDDAQLAALLDARAEGGPG